MIATYALLTCAMVPGPVLAGASGLLFGTALRTLIAIVSATLSASAAFLVARGLAQRPYAAPVTGRLRDWTQRIERRDFPAVLYARIAPRAPFALVSYAAGMARVRLREFTAATMIAHLRERLPTRHSAAALATTPPRRPWRGSGYSSSSRLAVLCSCGGHAEEGRRASVGGRSSESFGRPPGSHEGWLRPIKR